MAALLHDVCYFTGDITGIDSDLQVINSDEVKLILLGRSGLGFQGCFKESVAHPILFESERFIERRAVPD